MMIIDIVFSVLACLICLAAMIWAAIEDGKDNDRHLHAQAEWTKHNHNR